MLFCSCVVLVWLVISVWGLGLVAGVWWFLLLGLFSLCFAVIVLVWFVWVCLVVCVVLDFGLLCFGLALRLFICWI